MAGESIGINDIYVTTGCGFFGGLNCGDCPESGGMAIK
jgi:hypothetical protein